MTTIADMFVQSRRAIGAFSQLSDGGYEPATRPVTRDEYVRRDGTLTDILGWSTEVNVSGTVGTAPPDSRPLFDRWIGDRRGMTFGEWLDAQKESGAL